MYSSWTLSKVLGVEDLSNCLSSPLVSCGDLLVLGNY